MLIADGDAEQIFNDRVRKFVLLFLFFIGLQLSSYAIFLIFKKRTVYNISEYEEAMAEKMTDWICIFSFTITIGATLLLPISMISNEIVFMYGGSYYIMWLSDSLISDLWSIIFFVSNFVMFFMLPFVFFFSESEGLTFCEKGNKAKAHEAFITIFLLAMILIGFVWIINAFLDNDNFSFWNTFPILRSFMSYVGVFLLLYCMPLGLAQLLTTIGSKLVIPKIERVYPSPEYDENQPISLPIFRWSYIFREKQFIKYCREYNLLTVAPDQPYPLAAKSFESTLTKLVYERPVYYTTLYVFLLVFTVAAVFFVLQNMFVLTFGIRALPTYTENLTLGKTSLSLLGPAEVLFEIIIIVYLLYLSLVGIYSAPLLHYLKPKIRNTSAVIIIGNIFVLLTASCAFPKLIRTLGITNFNLPGSFGKMHWMENFGIVLFFNIIFAVTTLIVLRTKITPAIRKQLARRLLFFTGKNYPSEDEPPLSRPNSPTSSNEGDSSDRVENSQPF